MIRASLSTRSLAARLGAKATILAQAAAENRQRTRRADPLRWRLPRLLWPLITKGD
ncbi:hypothetical protein H0274_08155 [Altererythrobacter sp. CC-YST694]|uniref:hypothetical protein n=1 Tax=Altererythrobacter sp. CC-YST694 TaxID=2755038 RepID=UPI001D0217C2|nr:hypothetical protein [Altererythrobacter sp. CC-YST694]MCB5425226.1 hypothetical protein [Altererythrobacter sp. CC-YST694]